MLYPYISIFQRAAPATGRLLVWTLAIGVAMIPLNYAQHLQNAHGERFDLQIENRASVAITRWEMAGRLTTAVSSNRSTLDLSIPRSDWIELKPAEQHALQRRLACAVVRGFPIEKYTIRDEAANILATGPGTSER